MRTVYCISGLGADERVFKNLSVQGAKFKFINWLSPEPGETLSSYAARMSGAVQEKNPVLCGLSFGGMMALEISRIIPVSKLILISSIKSEKELPLWMKTCGLLRLQKALPSQPLHKFKALKAIRPVQNYFLGAKTEEEKRMANEYRDTVDPFYLKWSLNHVLNYSNQWLPPEWIHIHGTDDHIFPIRNIKPTHVIEGGGHFMIMNKSEQINRILEENICR